MAETTAALMRWYLIVKRRVLLRNPNETAHLKKTKQASVDLVIVAATREQKFKLEIINRLDNTLSEALNPSLLTRKFSESYNEEVLNAIQTFRKAHKALFGTGAKWTLHLYYVSQGLAPAKTNLLYRKARALEPKMRQVLPTLQDAHFYFIGATELVRLLDQPRKTDSTLACETPALKPRNGGCVALVSLKDYYKCIADKAGNFETQYSSPTCATSRVALKSTTRSRLR